MKYAYTIAYWVLMILWVTGLVTLINSPTLANEEEWVVNPIETVEKNDEKDEKQEELTMLPREEYLFNNVEKTVDLPWFWDYQDLLASYAYNTCMREWKSEWYYGCKNLVLTWNAENGWWNKDAVNTSNSNWTIDKGLCMLNDAYHNDFLTSEWFDNPLAQLDYCLNVWQDAERKGVMRWYAYAVRHQRNPWIQFIGWQPKTQVSYYIKASQAQQKADELRELCKETGECKQ